MARTWHHEKPAHERGYGHAWRRLRVRILQRDQGLCVLCRRKDRITVAQQVDHIVNKASGGGDEPENLMSLCLPCHQRKTTMEAGGRPRRQVALDGWPVE